MRGLLIAGLTVLAAGGAAPPPAGLPQVALQPEFVVTGGGSEPIGDRPLHPGETVGLVLSWPEGVRPPRPRLAGTSRPDAGRPIPRRLVPHDPRAGGRDVLEVLLAAVGEARLDPVELADATGRTVARTAPWTVTVAPALDEKETKPSPERPPVPIPLDRWGLLAAAGALAALVALAGWLIGRWRRRRSPPPAAPAPPPLPADVRALEALRALRAKGWHERGMTKPFCIALAEIGKRYLGELTGVPLLERTTSECPALLRGAGLPERWAAWCGAWLERIDLVKFAGERPDVRELLALLDELERAIRETRHHGAPAEETAVVAGEAR